jgi:hypothetical protein
MFAPMDGIGGAVMQLKAASASGGFSITEEGAQPLLSAVADLRTEVAQHLADSQTLIQAPPLGQTPGAQVYKPFMASVAGDQTQGLVPYLKNLQTQLDEVEATIKKAVSILKDSDQSNSSSINKAGH